MFSSGSRKDIPAPRAGASQPISPPVNPAAQSAITRTALREFSLLSLLELSNELNVKKDAYEIADVALFNLMGNFGCARASLWVFPEDHTKDPVLVRNPGLNDSVARALGAVWGRWLLSRPNGLREPVLVDELRGAMSSTGIDLAAENGIRVFAPVSARNEVLGLVALGKRVGGSEFTALDRNILQASLNLLGVAMENTNLYNGMVENNRRLRMANDKLQELDELKSQFLSNLNHELRTPITIMVAYLEMLQKQSGSEDTRREHMDVIQEQCRRLESLVVNLLDFSKVLGDELEIRVRMQSAVHSVRRYFEERRPGITAGLRELRFSAANEVPEALFDEARLFQILDALIDNAVKFCPAGSLIHLRVDTETQEGTDWVRVQVIDNGPGIAPDRLSTIFDSFRQADGSSTRRHGGVGLGLSFAREVATKMDGHLSAESKAGEGTAITLRLPAA